MSKSDEFCIKSEELCIKHDEFCSADAAGDKLSNGNYYHSQKFIHARAIQHFKNMTTMIQKGFPNAGSAKIMNFLSKTRNLVSKTRNYASKTRNFVLMMMNSSVGANFAPTVYKTDPRDGQQYCLNYLGETFQWLSLFREGSDLY